MKSKLGGLMITLLLGCGGTSSPAPAEPPSPAPAAAEATPPATADPVAQPDPYGCKPTITEGVPPTTEKLCGPEICIPRLEADEEALCEATEHGGCTHYLLARVEPDGATQPLNIYVRCPADPKKKTAGGKLEATLMRAYGESGVPQLAPDAKLPIKACIHIAVFECPAKEK